MTGLSPAPPGREWAPTAALIVIVGAPVVCGCQPPWASGFLVAAILLLASSHIALRTWRRRPWGWGSRSVAATASLCLLWLTLGVARDWLLGPEHGRVPALSVRELAYAGAFLGAAVLGGAYCRPAGRLLIACRAVAWVGLVLACFALAQLCGYDVKVLAGWGLLNDRASGLYTNANRFAVLLACCWLCAAGALLEVQRREGRPARGSRAERSLLAVALAVISAALALTFSRLTLMSMATALGLTALAWVILERRYADNEASLGVELSLVEKLRRVALLAVPAILVAGWATWCLMIGATPMRNRFATLATDLTLPGRIQAVKAAWPLLCAEPVWGWGLGTFESVFTSVQPPDLPGRWRALHSDWVQLGIEAGVPAVALLLALLAAWLRRCWRLASADFGSQRTTLALLPAASIFIAASCSLGDYPLREPATAILVFFLAGAVCAPRQDDERPLARSRPVYAACSVVLVLGLLAGAWSAGRNGLAYAASPWLGHIACPLRSSAQLRDWRTAARVDPGDPELQYRLAASAFAAAGRDKALLAFARDAVRQAATLQPYDYRLPWLEAAIAERRGERGELFRLRELAASRAPGKPLLREHNGRAYLQYAVLGSPPGDPAREEGLARALEHFRAALHADACREGEIVRTMEDAGCLNSEIAELWPAGTEGAWLRRARFYCDKEQWDWAERELPAAAPPPAAEAKWYHAIRGTMELRRGVPGLGRKDWKRAISPHAFGYDASLETWLAGQARGIEPAECEVLAETLMPELGRHTVLAAALGKALLDDRRWSACDKLLAQVAARSPDLSALWAELALEMGDLAAAANRARAAWEMDLTSTRWSRWYARFRDKLKEKRK